MLLRSLELDASGSLAPAFKAEYPVRIERRGFACPVSREVHDARAAQVSRRDSLCVYVGVIAGSMLRLREYLATKNGTIISGVVAVVAVLGVCYFVWQTFAPSAAVAEANSRWFVDSTNGKPFRLKPVLGQTLPVKAPSGGMTGYPAELCYWNADGTVREEPTYVLLNSWLGKPEPTFCPDCGRLVVGHNPVPTEGAKPPPTREEYNNRRHH